MTRPEIVHRAASSLVRIMDEAAGRGLGPPDISAAWRLANAGATVEELRAAVAIANSELEERVTDIVLGLT